MPLFEHFGESQHAQTTEAVLQAGLLPAQERRKGHFAKVAGRLKKSFRRPTCHAYDYAALIVPTAVCICIGMHAVKRRNRTHEIHNLHKTHRPIFVKCQRGRQERRKGHFQLFEHFGESQHAQTTEAVLQAGLLPAQERRKGHFAKVAGRLKKSFRRPTCHAYDYAALIVPTAVCICIGMHAVKRRNRTHEIHNLHKTHRPILPIFSAEQAAWFTFV